MTSFAKQIWLENYYTKQGYDPDEAFSMAMAVFRDPEHPMHQQYEKAIAD